MTKDIKVVIGANFGDEGKGLMTDYYAAKATGSKVVVLYNGGSQRAHTVTTPEGHRHVFRHLGSGTFVGAATYIARQFIVNPIIFRQEYEEFVKVYNIRPRVYMHPDCIFSTIFDMFINQMQEAARGSEKHGSCGMGVYETILRNQPKSFDFINKINVYKTDATVSEFSKMSYLNQYIFLRTIAKEYMDKRLTYFKLLDKNEPLYHAIISDTSIKHFIDDFNFMISHIVFTDEMVLNSFDTVIFEGGQGMLLDMDNKEYFPHLTPSHTTLKNVIDIIKEAYGNFIIPAEVCYVTRSYMTRHGTGRFDTECDKRFINANMVDATNVPNPFQDTLRYGTLDVVDMVKRVQQDFNKYYPSFTWHRKIAMTHTNEYMERKFWYSDISYVSDGMTRNSVNVARLLNY